MWGAPLRLIDGVAPPLTHSEDNFRFVKGNSGSEIANESPNFKKFRPFMHEVADGSLFTFHDLEKAKEYVNLKLTKKTQEKKKKLKIYTSLNLYF